MAAPPMGPSTLAPPISNTFLVIRIEGFDWPNFLPCHGTRAKCQGWKERSFYRSSNITTMFCALFSENYVHWRELPAGSCRNKLCKTRADCCQEHANCYYSSYLKYSRCLDCGSGQVYYDSPCDEDGDCCGTGRKYCKYVKKTCFGCGGDWAKWNCDA